MEVQANKRCSKCKQIKALSDFYVRADRPRPCSHCIDCTKARYQERYTTPEHRKKQLANSKKWQEENSLQTRYLIAKSLATNPKRRQSREFSLTKTECVALWSQGCHYCNSNILSDTGMGLDRKDNNRGYTIDNVLPCCGDCNKVRNTVLTVEEMEVAMKAVLALRSSSGAT